MIKPKLLVFGDSWSNNYFSKENPLVKGIKPHLGSNHVKDYVEYHDHYGHWIDHMKTYYDVYSYGVGAATNEQIILQLGNLKNYDYQTGDRIIIIFTTPERFDWVINKKKYGFVASGRLPEFFYPKETKVINLLRSQNIERYEWWIDNKVKKDEKLFIEMIPSLFGKWDPLMVTWSDSLNIDMVEPIPVDDTYTTIEMESGGKHIDHHLGVHGNYSLFKFFSEKLNIDISQHNDRIKEFKSSVI